MNIDDLYMAARARGLTRSKRHFSKAFLCRAPNYFADRGSSGCSAATFLNLYRRFGELGEVELQAMTFQRLLEVEARDGETCAVTQP